MDARRLQLLRCARRRSLLPVRADHRVTSGLALWRRGFVASVACLMALSTAAPACQDSVERPVEVHKSPNAKDSEATSADVRLLQPTSGFAAESTNFVVRAADATLAKQVAIEAERYRRELSQEWLGYTLPDWSEKCPITVELAPHSGGETSFIFVGPQDARRPTEWNMKIFGPPNRLLDAVLPHEITHTIFATHYGRPLPRWADEGACTTVEHESERRKIQNLLIEYLTAKPSKGIPFNRLFVMMQYPSEMLPLYAQSYSLARFLILQKGRQHFVQFVNAGLMSQSHPQDVSGWDRSIHAYYGFRDLSELQVAWIQWVKSGSPEDVPSRGAVTSQNVASQNTAPQYAAPTEPRFDVAGQSQAPPNRLAALPAVSGAPPESNSWYRQQMAHRGADHQTATTQIGGFEYNTAQSARSISIPVDVKGPAGPAVPGLRAEPNPAGPSGGLIQGELSRPLFENPTVRPTGRVPDNQTNASPRLWR